MFHSISLSIHETLQNEQTRERAQTLTNKSQTISILLLISFINPLNNTRFSKESLNILPKQREFFDNIGESLTLLFLLCTVFAARTVGKKKLYVKEGKKNSFLNFIQKVWVRFLRWLSFGRIKKLFFSWNKRSEIKQEMDSKNQKIKRPKRTQKVIEDYWDCSVCTFRNTAEAFKCSMCDVRKGKIAKNLANFVAQNVNVCGQWGNLMAVEVKFQDSVA